MTLKQRFPDATKEFRILSTKSFGWSVRKCARIFIYRFVAWLLILAGFALAGILILIVMGLLKALGVKEL